MNFLSRFFLKLAGAVGGWSERSGSVLFAEYPLAKDLSGIDFVSLLDQTREDVEAAVGPLAERQRMSEKRMALQSITAMSGQVADEVHLFPSLSQGAYENYKFLFKKGVLIGLSCQLNPERTPNQANRQEPATPSGRGST